MGLFPSHLRLLIRAHQIYGFHGPVCTLGNQDTWATHQDLISYFREAGCETPPLREVRPHSSHTFADGPLAILARDFVHAETFFRMCGIPEYFDVDAFAFDNPRIVHDLNHPVPASLKASCGLLVDGGTVEHIFDVRQTLSNIVDMLRIDGHVVHMASFEMDHGFFAFSPTLFFDFYAANGFTDFSCSILHLHKPEPLKTYRDPVQMFQYQYGMRLDGLLEPDRQPAVFFVARKQHAVDAISVPTQGIYATRARGEPTKTAPTTTKPLFERVVPGWAQRPLTPLRTVLHHGAERVRREVRRRSLERI